MKCDKWCVGNYKGECAVEKCEGAIRAIMPEADSKKSAKEMYECAISMFHEPKQESEDRK